MSVRCDMCERKICNGEDCVHSGHADVCFRCVDLMYEQLVKRREAEAAAKKIADDLAVKEAAIKEKEAPLEEIINSQSEGGEHGDQGGEHGEHGDQGGEHGEPA